jgi:hypothetical protein
MTLASMHGAQAILGAGHHGGVELAPDSTVDSLGKKTTAVGPRIIDLAPMTGYTSQSTHNKLLKILHPRSYLLRVKMEKSPLINSVLVGEIRS